MYNVPAFNFLAHATRVIWLRGRLDEHCAKSSRVPGYPLTQSDKYVGISMSIQIEMDQMRRMV